MNWHLDATLENDCFLIKELGLCRVLLMNNRLFPWVIIVPRIANTVEVTDLTPENRNLLMEEICQVSAALQKYTSAYKMNIATLGNMVRQLHIHIIARRPDDAAWPDPVWGKKRELYTENDARDFISNFAALL